MTNLKINEDTVSFVRMGKLAETFCICFGLIAPTLMLWSYVY